MENKKIINQEERSRKLFMFSALVVPTLFFLVFFVYVNFDSLLMAFQRPDYSSGSLVEQFTFENFRLIFSKNSGLDEILESIKNTLIFFFSDLIIVFPISIFMSYFFFKKMPGFRFFRFVFYLPSVIASSVLVILFKYVIGDGGIIDAIMTKQGKNFFYLLSQAPDALYTIVFYNVMFSFGGNIIVFGGSMNGVNSEVLEAGRIDGCGWMKELFLLVIPMMWPTISTIVILKMTGILSASGPILAFTKGGVGTMTLSYLLYALVSGVGKSQDLYYASAVGVVMTVVVFPITMLVKHLVYSDKKDAEDTL